MEKKQLLEIRKARQEVADIFATTLLNMILDGKIGSDEDRSLKPKQYRSIGESSMDPQPCR